MSEVSLLIRKQEKKMTEVLVKKTHFTHVEVERLFQIYRCFFISNLIFKKNIQGQCHKIGCDG